MGGGSSGNKFSGPYTQITCKTHAPPTFLPTTFAPLDASNTVYYFPRPEKWGTRKPHQSHRGNVVEGFTLCISPPPAPVTSATRPSKRRVIAVLTEA